MSIIDFPGNKNNQQNSNKQKNKDENTIPSQKPYLVRAIYDWCSDYGYKPYLAVAVDKFTRVPNEFVSNGQIVLNINREAVNKLEISNDYVYFWARFSGVEREIFIPIGRVIAIYAKENGVGMQFMPEDSPYDDDDNNPNNPNLPKGLHIVE